MTLNCTPIFDPILAPEEYVKSGIATVENEFLWQSRGPVDFRDGSCRKMVGRQIHTASGNVEVHACNCSDNTVVVCQPTRDLFGDDTLDPPRLDTGNVVMQGQQIPFVTCELFDFPEFITVTWPCVVTIPTVYEGRGARYVFPDTQPQGWVSPVTYRFDSCRRTPGVGTSGQYGRANLIEPRIGLLISELTPQPNTQFSIIISNTFALQNGQIIVGPVEGGSFLMGTSGSPMDGRRASFSPLQIHSVIPFEWEGASVEMSVGPATNCGAGADVRCQALWSDRARTNIEIVC